MPSHADQQLWEREQAFLAEERTRAPELFVTTKKPADELYQRIGIGSYPSNLAKGYIKYSPLDFIVEEIRQDGTVSTVDGVDPAPKPPMAGTGTVYADLVKVGISTLDAASRMSDALKIEPKHIGHAGIKDAVALTSQTLSFRQTSLEAVQALALPNIVLKHVVEGKGAIGIGNLKGNRFTLFIRTEQLVDETAFAALVADIKANGALNYYGPQRFGSPRFLSHLFGMHLMRGEPELCVRAYFSKTSPFEIPYHTQLRERLAAKFGDWAAVRDEIKNLPYTYRYEHLMLDALEGTSGEQGYAMAIGAVPQQADLWVRAYASFLTNLILSEAGKTGKPLPETIPLLLSLDESAQTFYAAWTKQHGTENFAENLRKFRFTNFINIGKAPSIQARIRPTVHGFNIVPEGVAISFDLPKGAYATTILMYLFDTVTGMPIPAWLQSTDVDTKKLLGTGDLTAIKETLGPSIRQMMEKKQGEEAET